MVDTRTVTLPAIWADDAITEIPTPPIANTTYRNTDLGSTELLQGWPYQKIVDSADFNQTLWLISNLVKSCEQYGIMPWCASTTYKQNGICLASNGIFYWAKKDNTGVNPVTDSGMTNWGVFLDPGDNFVTETVLMNQINLCEKLANKTQTLSSSSTSTQYPSAKAVYDNINNLQNSKQNNITGGASSITTSNLTTNRALVSDGSGKVAVSAVTNTELGYLDGVTSNIQTQLNGKQASGSYMTLSGNQTVGGIKTFSGQIILSATPGASDNSNQVPNTAWVNSRITSIMGTVYPVGSLYFGTQSTCPLAAIIDGSTWEKVGSSLITSVNTSVPVKGNGKTMGWTNGDANFGCSQGDNGYGWFFPSLTSEAYGKDIGVVQAGNTGARPSGGKLMGLTSNANNSGIVGTITRTALTVNIWKRTA